MTDHRYEQEDKDAIQRAEDAIGRPLPLRPSADRVYQGEGKTIEELIAELRAGRDRHSAFAERVGPATRPWVLKESNQAPPGGTSRHLRSLWVESPEGCIVSWKERRSGAHRGESPRGLGFDPWDLANARLIANAAALRDALAGLLGDCIAEAKRRGLDPDTFDNIRAAQRVLDDCNHGPDPV
jgi:hypothetical protein